MFACVFRARCGVLFTPPVAHKGIVISCKRNHCRKILSRSKTRSAILSMPTRTKMRRTKYSISIVFLETVAGESDGSVKLDDYFLVRLSGANL